MMFGAPPWFLIVLPGERFELSVHYTEFYLVARSVQDFLDPADEVNKIWGKLGLVSKHGAGAWQC